MRHVEVGDENVRHCLLHLSQRRETVFRSSNGMSHALEGLTQGKPYRRIIVHNQNGCLGLDQVPPPLPGCVDLRQVWKERQGLVCAILLKPFWFVWSHVSPVPP